MARDPYITSRQRWLAQALDDLQARGKLLWFWRYNAVQRRAIFWVGLTGAQPKPHLIKPAEAIVQRLYDELGERWMPVPQPGGERELLEVRKQLQR